MVGLGLDEVDVGDVSEDARQAPALARVGAPDVAHPHELARIRRHDRLLRDLYTCTSW